MARISSYTKDTTPNDNDLLVGSEYINTVNGVDNFDPISDCFVLSARGKRCIANSTACNASATSPCSV